MGEYNEILKDVMAQRQKNYEVEARDEWQRYYELQNFTNLDKLSGIEFEHAIARLYSKMGYTTKITSSSSDFGVDVLASKDGSMLAIQAKRYTNTVGVSAVQEVSSGKLYYKADSASVVTTSTFTKNAKKLASESEVTLIDYRALEALWTKHFPKKDIPEFDIDIYDNTIIPKSTKRKR
jgi:restriction system protein